MMIVPALETMILVFAAAFRTQGNSSLSSTSRGLWKLRGTWYLWKSEWEYPGNSLLGFTLHTLGSFYLPLDVSPSLHLHICARFLRVTLCRQRGLRWGKVGKV